MATPKEPATPTALLDVREGSVRIFTKEQGEKDGYLEIPAFYSRTGRAHGDTNRGRDTHAVSTLLRSGRNDHALT